MGIEGGPQHSALISRAEPELAAARNAHVEAAQFRERARIIQPHCPTEVLPLVKIKSLHFHSSRSTHRRGGAV